MVILKSVLGRYKYKLTSYPDGIVISKNSGSSLLKTYLIFAILLITVGILSILIFSTFVGIILLVSGVPLLLKVKKLRRKEQTYQHILIGSTSLKIKKNRQKQEIKKTEILDISHNISGDSELSTASLLININDPKKISFEQVILIQLFGSDKRHILDDILLLKKEFAQLLSIDESSIH